VKPYMLKLIMYSRHIYEKHVLSIPRVYIGSWIAHIELQMLLRVFEIATFFNMVTIFAEIA